MGLRIECVQFREKVKGTQVKSPGRAQRNAFATGENDGSSARSVTARIFLWEILRE